MEFRKKIFPETSPALSEQINFLVGGSCLLITWEIKKKTSWMRRHLSSRREKRGEVRIVKLLDVRETRTTCGPHLQPCDIAGPLFVIHEPRESLEPNSHSNCARVRMAQNALAEVA